MRSAEKARRVRNDGVKFEDNVAKICIEAYNSLCPHEMNISTTKQQAVVGGILVFIPSIDPIYSFRFTKLCSFPQWIECSINETKLEEVSGQLILLSLGVGTKVGSAESIMQHRKERRTADAIVRDQHAEVLARRCFVRFLYNLLLNNRDTSGKESMDSARCLSSLLFEATDNDSKFPLRLRKGLSLHLYSSSQPCGNACIKKWAKSRSSAAEPWQSDYLPHPRLYITAKDQGQVSLLLKHNGNETGNSSFGSMIVPPGLVAPTPLSLQSRVDNKTDDRIKCSDKKVNESHASMTPIVASNVMSCSDKICLWNALGLQGALLSEFFLPLTLQTITVGRKASAVHARRALCCRLQDFSFVHDCGGSSCVIPVYRTVHPHMLVTAEKLDEGTILTKEASSTESLVAEDLNSKTSCGAKFEDFRSLCVWLNISGGDYSREVLDGRSGYQMEEVPSESMERQPVSRISSLSFLESFLTVQHLLTSCGKGGKEYNDKRHYKSNGILSEAYIAAKRKIQSDVNLFPQWVRKHSC